MAISKEKWEEGGGQPEYVPDAKFEKIRDFLYDMKEGVVEGKKYTIRKQYIRGRKGNAMWFIVRDGEGNVVSEGMRNETLGFLYQNT